MVNTVLWVIFLSICSTEAVANQKTSTEVPEAKPTIPSLPDVNAELLKLVVDDQWDRGMDMFGGRMVRSPETLDWEAIARRDEQRQNSVRSLLAAGAIGSARDYHFAALIFQHSARPENLAMAHVLASTAAVKGFSNARWLAAASLDRYLMAVKRGQVFGTQFIQNASEEFTMEPYDRDAVTDRIRAEWCVVSLAEQAQILEEMRAGKPVRSTTAASCAGKPD